MQDFSVAQIAGGEVARSRLRVIPMEEGVNTY